MKLLINPVSAGPHWGGPDYLMIVVDDAFNDFLAVARRSAKVAAEQAGDKFNMLELDIDNLVQEFWVDDPWKELFAGFDENDETEDVNREMFTDKYLILEGKEADRIYNNIGKFFPQYDGLSYTTAKVDCDGDVFFVVQEKHSDNEFCCEYPM